MSRSVPDHLLSSLFKAFVEEFNRTNTVGRRSRRKRKARNHGDDLRLFPYAEDEGYGDETEDHHIEDCISPYVLNPLSPSGCDDRLGDSGHRIFDTGNDFHHLGGNELAGVIFMCNLHTKKECLRHGIFGLPISKKLLVEQVFPGMLLFLFEFERRELWGIFKATTYGQMDIMPNAYSGGSFPCQVRVEAVGDCIPLKEEEFSEAIRENYYSSDKFGFALSRIQVYHLYELFMRKHSNFSKKRGKVSRQEADHLPLEGVAAKDFRHERNSAGTSLLKRSAAKPFISTSQNAALPCGKAHKDVSLVPLPNCRTSRMAYADDFVLNNQSTASRAYLHSRDTLDGYPNESGHVMNQCGRLMPVSAVNTVTHCSRDFNLLNHSTVQDTNPRMFLWEVESSSTARMPSSRARRELAENDATDGEACEGGSLLGDIDGLKNKVSVWSRISRCAKQPATAQCKSNPQMSVAEKPSNKASDTKVPVKACDTKVPIKACDTKVPAKACDIKVPVKARDIKVSNTARDIKVSNKARDIVVSKSSHDPKVSKKFCEHNIVVSKSSPDTKVSNKAHDTNVSCVVDEFESTPRSKEQKKKNRLVKQCAETSSAVGLAAHNVEDTKDVDFASQEVSINFNRRRMIDRKETAGTCADLQAKKRRKLNRPEFGISMDGLKVAAEEGKKASPFASGVLKASDTVGLSGVKGAFGLLRGDCVENSEGSVLSKQSKVTVESQRETHVASPSCELVTGDRLGGLAVASLGHYSGDNLDSRQGQFVEVSKMAFQPKEMHGVSQSFKKSVSGVPVEECKLVPSSLIDQPSLKPADNMILSQTGAFTTRSQLQPGDTGTLKILSMVPGMGGQNLSDGLHEAACFLEQQELLSSAPESSSAYSQVPAKELEDSNVEADVSSLLKGESKNMQIRFVVDNSLQASNMKLQLCDTDDYKADTPGSHELAVQGGSQCEIASSSIDVLNQVGLKSLQDGLQVSSIKLQLGAEPCIILQLSESFLSKLSASSQHPSGEGKCKFDGTDSPARKDLDGSKDIDESAA